MADLDHGASGSSPRRVYRLGIEFSQTAMTMDWGMVLGFIVFVPVLLVMFRLGAGWEAAAAQRDAAAAQREDA